MTTHISLIITVLNEKETILPLLNSIASQNRLPNEVIISDGGSTDGTQELIRSFAMKNLLLNIKLIEIHGNRSVGRNAAIASAEHSVIAITDAGCELDKKWLSELEKKYLEKKRESTNELVVSGYYTSKPNSDFEAAVVPYVLVMPKNIDPENFLPATRSMLLDKSVWEKVGKFDEKLRWNEDFAFAKKIQKAGVQITFAQDAVVSWVPRKNISEFWKMIFHFAYGDAEAKILRLKGLFIFFRYLVGFLLILLFFMTNEKVVVGLLTSLLITAYIVWSYCKNASTIKRGKYWLPLLQIVSDVAVMAGTVLGLLS